MSFALQPQTIELVGDRVKGMIGLCNLVTTHRLFSLLLVKELNLRVVADPCSYFNSLRYLLHVKVASHPR